jgi:hypothetical protein
LPFNLSGYGKLWQITREVQQERQPDRDKKKPAHLRRLVQEMSTQYVLRILTNQYLWDLDCGVWHPTSPVLKSKRMSRSATRCEFYLRLLHVEQQAKKTCVRTQAGVKLGS